MVDLATNVIHSKVGNTYLFYVGQAGYLIKSKSGKLLGIDLYLSNCVERIEGNMGFKRLQPNILKPSDLYIDLLIATHFHRDHFDIDTIPELISNNKTKLLVSVDCKNDIDAMSINKHQVCYVTPGFKKCFDDFYIEFVNCDHGQSAPDAVGVIVTVDKLRILFTGDTCLRLDYIDEYKKDGDIDILLAPINGAYGNLDERDCAILSSKLKPKLTIPSHYGMFASHGGNPGLFIKYMNEICPKNNYYIFTLGEGIII